jgi:hypothetical protein
MQGTSLISLLERLRRSFNVTCLKWAWNSQGYAQPSKKKPALSSLGASWQGLAAAEVGLLDFRQLPSPLFLVGTCLL